jgi:hypothetical protein
MNFSSYSPYFPGFFPNQLYSNFSPCQPNFSPNFILERLLFEEKIKGSHEKKFEFKMDFPEFQYQQKENRFNFHFRIENIQNMGSLIEKETKKNDELVRDIIQSNESLKLTAANIFIEVSRLKY